MSETNDSSICCGEKMVPILRYLEDGRIHQTLQCNACFRILERPYIAEEKEEEK